MTNLPLEFYWKRKHSEMNFQGYCNAEISGSEDPIRLLHYYKGLFLALQNAL